MRKHVLLLSFLLTAAAPPATPHWQPAQVNRLVEWLDAAPGDALDPPALDIPLVRDAMASRDSDRIDRVATAAALHLLSAHRVGCCNNALRTDWHIAGTSYTDEPAETLRAALDANALDRLFATARPSHPFYYALRAAYSHEDDAGRRAILAANLDRWRWMPRQLGQRYVLVNTAAFEATLWENGRQTGRWKVVVGKTGSPTPVFSTRITGVIFNPWWEIPTDIAAEGIAALVRDHPAAAAAKGYVFDQGRYRQRPGAGNALGRMKLVMPNGYSVYLHDTPSRGLFDRDVRAFSHGCVRVGDALGLTAALLADQPAWSRERIDALVASGSTVNVKLSAPVPVYIAYFTAEPDGDSHIRYFPDIYHRDVSPGHTPEDDVLCKR